MLVDPNTGMPVETDTPESLLGGALSAQSASAGALSAVGQQAGFFGPGSVPDAALDAVPGLAQTTAWNTFRGSRTIAYGGKGVNQISGFRATMSPRYLGRMPSMGALGGRSIDSANYAIKSSKYAPGQVYSPLNVLATGGNYAFRKIAKPIDNRIAAGSSVGRIGQRISSLNAEGEAFSRGAFARVTAADKMARGKLPTGNVLNFLGETDKALATEFKAIKARSYAVGQAIPKARPTINMSPFGTQSAINARTPISTPLAAVMPNADEAARLTYASVDGAISGRISGFMSQVRLGSGGMNAVKAAEASGNKAFGAGVKAAEKFMSSAGLESVGGKLGVKAGGEIAQKLGVQGAEKLGLKTVGKLAAKGSGKLAAKAGAALAVNAVPVAGQIVSAVLLADLAMDVGKLGVEVFKSGVDFAKDAAISYKGSINKGVMGMGYRDNTVAATSRARGVQAIQNSRLNARSVLGSEAGAMHAHFG